MSPPRPASTLKSLLIQARGGATPPREEWASITAEAERLLKLVGPTGEDDDVPGPITPNFDEDSNDPDELDVGGGTAQTTKATGSSLEVALGFALNKPAH